MTTAALKDLDRDAIGQLFLKVLIAVQIILIFKTAFQRYFNFDEFQVLYASASLLRGKALYSDAVGIHSPLLNIVISFLLKAIGFQTLALIASRLFIAFCLFVTLFYTHRIGRMIRGGNCGWIAIALVLSSLAFVHKGIEIRHDVLNLMFNTMGAFYAVRYANDQHKKSLFIAAVLLGLALASTQKAIVWNVGIMTGLSVSIWKSGNKETARLLPSFLILWIIPLFLSLLCLVVMYRETFQAILQIMILDRMDYLHPVKKDLYPFPHSKIDIYMRLLKDNGVFYVVSIISGIALLFKTSEEEKSHYIIIFWAFFGVAFYLFMKRPFYQSFLPSIPPLAILAAVALSGMSETYLRSAGKSKWIIAYVLGVLIFISWPLKNLYALAMSPPTLSKQMKNVSFCLENLDRGDKVLCFTQQAIFFDQIFPEGMRPNECGRTIHMLNRPCVIQKMIQSRCKIVIYDYRTRLLNNQLIKEIKHQYLYTGIGDIYVPGFVIPSGRTVEKTVWISGTYHCTSGNIEIDGKPLNARSRHLENQMYIIKNLGPKAAAFLYVFND